MRRLLVLAVAVPADAFAAQAFAADAAAGKAVFDAAKPACKGCHTDTKNPVASGGWQVFPIRERPVLRIGRFNRNEL